MKKYFKRGMCFAMITLFPLAAYADTGDGLDNVLNALIAFLTSTPARLIFVLSIIGVGYATIGLGRIPKERGFAIVLGVGLVFGASWLAQQILGA